MIKEYEKFLPEDYFNKISDIAKSSKGMPWYFLESVAYENDNVDYDSRQYGFSHLLFDNAPNSVFFEDFYPIINFMEKRNFINVYNLSRMRLGLQVRVDSKSIINKPHIDHTHPHQVLLLYLNESDGDTIFYNNNGEIIKRVSPKENSAVLFDGSIMHSSSTPSKNSRRIALNVNFNFLEN